MRVGALAGVSTIKAPSVSRAPVRQTVLFGRTDTTLSHSPPNALSIGSGLSVTLNASSANPFTVSFADGFDSSGAIDWVTSLTANMSFSPGASATSYLYLDRSTTGAITTGTTTLAPIYSYVAPASPATNQHWFDKVTFKMWVWSGSVWTAVQRVFVGSCTTGASTVSSVITYGYNGRGVSAWVNLLANGVNNVAFLQHNLGMSVTEGEQIIALRGRSANAVEGTIPASFFPSGGSTYGYFSTYTSDSKLSFGLIGGTAGLFLDLAGWCTNGDFQVTAIRGW